MEAGERSLLPLLLGALSYIKLDGTRLALVLAGSAASVCLSVCCLSFVCVCLGLGLSGGFIRAPGY